MSIIPSLLRELWNTLSHTTLVSISTSCSVVLAWGSSTVFLSKWSLMKFRSISACWVLSCYTGLFAIFITDSLSQCNFIGDIKEIAKSLKIRFIHKSSHTQHEPFLWTLPQHLIEGRPFASYFSMWLSYPHKISKRVISIWSISDPVWISKTIYLVVLILPKKQTFTWWWLEISKNSIYSFHMSFTWSMHESIHHTHIIGYIWSCVR